MNWYKIHKQADKLEFVFNKESESIWRKMLKKEQDFTKINFDLENDDTVGSIKEIKTNIADEFDPKYKYIVLAQLCRAGGDWESPISYFRCQIKIDKQFKEKFIYIPSQAEGNTNLVKTKHGWMANDGDYFQKVNDKELWNSLKDHVNKRIKEWLKVYKYFQY